MWHHMPAGPLLSGQVTFAKSHWEVQYTRSKMVNEAVRCCDPLLALVKLRHLQPISYKETLITDLDPCHLANTLIWTTGSLPFFENSNQPGVQTFIISMKMWRDLIITRFWWHRGPQLRNKKAVSYYWISLKRLGQRTLWTWTFLKYRK